MRNLTFRERAILVGAMLIFLVGAAHRYWRGKSLATAVDDPASPHSAYAED